MDGRCNRISNIFGNIFKRWEAHTWVSITILLIHFSKSLSDICLIDAHAAAPLCSSDMVLSHIGPRRQMNPYTEMESPLV